MRVPYLLLMGFIALFVCCKTNGSLHKAQHADYDSLKRYSYLLIGLPHVREGNIRDATDVSTGFFFRDTNNRLFLVSAYHVLTGCDVLAKARHGTQDDTLRVWYMDKMNNYKFEQFPLTAYENKPCKSAGAIPDLDTMDVSDYFKDGKIFSIEKMAPHHLSQHARIPVGDVVVCYGYPDNTPDKVPSKAGDKLLMPRRRTSKVIEDPKFFIDTLVSIYMTVHPGFKKGFSGAPVFRRKADGTVEFAGIQSSKKRGRSKSLAVRAAELGRLVQWK
jgi:hypothetical protein